MLKIAVYFIILVLITVGIFITRKNLMGKVLYCFYTAIGLFSVIGAEMKIINYYNTTLFSYLYLIFIFSISFYPFAQNNTQFISDKLDNKVNIKYVIFSIVFIIMAMISIKCYIPVVHSLSVSGNWNINRDILYSGELLLPYSNLLEYIAMNFVGYTKILALLIGFTMLRSNEKNLLGIIIIFISFVSSVLSAACTSSRAQVVHIVLLVVVMYLFFFKNIAKNKKRFITILIILGIIGILPYIIQVTASRFGVGSEIISIISYLGQPPIVFSRGVFNIKRCLYGKYSLGILFGLDTFDQSQIGGAWGSGFYTYVGWLYIDWGLIGTIVIVSIISYIVYKIIAKKKYTISDLYIIFFVYYTLLQGAFVIGRSYIYSIVAALVIYVFVKLFFDKYTIVFGRVRL